jgi:hypothetical protein
MLISGLSNSSAPRSLHKSSSSISSLGSSPRISHTQSRTISLIRLMSPLSTSSRLKHSSSSSRRRIASNSFCLRCSSTFRASLRLRSKSSPGALALPGHLRIAALPLHFGGRASGVHSNAEHWNEGQGSCLTQTVRSDQGRMLSIPLR